MTDIPLEEDQDERNSGTQEMLEYLLNEVDNTEDLNLVSVEFDDQVTSLFDLFLLPSENDGNAETATTIYSTSGSDEEHDYSIDVVMGL